MPDFLPLAIASALYPPIMAMVVLILARPNPRPLLAAYVFGALLVSIGVGVGIVAALNAGNVVGGSSSSDRTVNPTVDIAAGLASLFVGWVILTNRDLRVREWRAHRKERKALKSGGRDPWSRRILERDSLTLTFLVGVALNLPGVSYAVALKDIAAADQSTGAQLAQILAFNLIMFVAAEVPLVSYAIRPDRTREVVIGINDWLGSHGRQIAMTLCLIVGALLLARGIAHAVG